MLTFIEIAYTSIALILMYSMKFHEIKNIFSNLLKSLINNRMGRVRIDREAFEVGFKGWDWSMGSMQDPWYAGFHPRAARTRAKRAYKFFSRRQWRRNLNLG